MIRKLGLLACVSMFLAASALAQGIQNMDVFFSVGIHSIRARTVEGIEIPKKTGWTFNSIYGYQFLRKSAASLWFDIAMTSGGAGYIGSVGTRYWVFTPGLRLSVPVHARVAIYGVAGGGAGSFYGRPYLPVGETPHLTNHIAWHGVAEIGGGVDFRLSRHWSIRGELRDFVTGRGLSGVEGRHHRSELFGVGLHF